MTRTCNGCGKPTSAKALRCSHCGLSAPLPHEPRSHEPVRCPTCVVRTDRVHLAELELDLCGHCAGLWFDRTELKAFGGALSDRDLADDLRALLESLSAHTPTRTVTYASCPVCAQLMTRRVYASVSGVLIDRCAAHGTWVDRDAAIRLVRLMRGEGEAELRALEADRVVTDLKRRVRSLEAAQVTDAAKIGAIEARARLHLVLDALDIL